MALTKAQIERYLREVGAELYARGLRGEIMLVGGAYMTAVLNARESTKDVDAIIVGDTKPIRDAVIAVARRHDLPPDWLNDAVKGFIYRQPRTSLWAEYPGLRVHSPGNDYMLAMKANSARPDDKKDVLILCREMGIKSPAEVMDVVERYIPADHVRVQVQYFIEALFEKK